MEKSFGKPKKVLEKRKNGQVKNLHKNKHVYNNCNELPSRAIKNIAGRLPIHYSLDEIQQISLNEN